MCAEPDATQRSGDKNRPALLTPVPQQDKDQHSGGEGSARGVNLGNNRLRPERKAGRETERPDHCRQAAPAEEHAGQVRHSEIVTAPITAENKFVR